MAYGSGWRVSGIIPRKANHNAGPALRFAPPDNYQL